MWIFRPETPEKDAELNFKTIGGIVLGIFFFLYLLTAIVVVPTGSVGIVTQFGKVTGRVMESGFNLELPRPFQSATLFDTKVQKEQQNAAAASSDLQDVSTTVAVNYHLQKDKVPGIFSSIGESYKDKLIDPAIQEAIKSVTAKFTATEMITNRQAVKDQTENVLKARLATYGIIVDATSIVNFSFSYSFNKAIEDKQVAQQSVLKAQQDLARVKVEAEQTVTQAQAQADAQKVQQQTLTPELLQKYAIDKWNGTLPQYNAGNLPFVTIPAK